MLEKTKWGQHETSDCSLSFNCFYNLTHPPQKSLPRIHFAPPQTSKVLLYSLYFYIPRHCSLPAVRRHKTNREYLMLSKPSGSCEGPDDSARHMCGDGERCCVIVWRGCCQSVVPPHGATVRHSPDPLEPPSHLPPLPPHPPPPFFRLRVKHLLLSFCLSLPSPTSAFQPQGFFFPFLFTIAPPSNEGS